MSTDVETTKAPSLDENGDIVDHAYDTLKESSIQQSDKSSPVKDDQLKKKPKLISRPSFKKDKIDSHYDTQPWAFAAVGRLLGLKFAPIYIPVERRFQTFAAFFWMSTFLFMGFGSLVILTYLFFYTQYWWISFSYLTFFLADRTVSERGGRRVQFMREWRLWKHFANFFPAKIIKTCDYDTKKNYIFGYHPHGILSAGAMAHFATEGTGFSKLFPGLTPHLLVLGGHFLLPLYRDFFMSSGAVSASRRSINYLLGEDQRGRALCLVVGGAPESLDCHPNQVVLHLNKRKGFCKIALLSGASLVPTFSFGENAIYEQLSNPPGSTIRNIQDSLQKIIGLAPCIVMGRGIFQYSFGIVPFRKPINTVFGTPIDVPKVRNPTSEQICDLHQRYVDAVVKLYNDYKDQFAEDPTIPITIV